jgi:enoyl-CoA hydratase/carnithine racemase
LRQSWRDDTTVQPENITFPTDAKLLDRACEKLVKLAKKFMPRLIGDRRTKELFLLNRVLSADEAVAWGLVNRVVAPEELAAAVDEIAQQLARGPTLAFASVKRLLLSSDNEDLER